MAGKVVRLVELSGVGKTRLAQALFDARTGARPLPPSLAIYTNLSDDPDPQPTGLASDLIANRTRVILIVDNCPPDLHRRLAEIRHPDIARRTLQRWIAAQIDAGRIRAVRKGRARRYFASGIIHKETDPRRSDIFLSKIPLSADS